MIAGVVHEGDLHLEGLALVRRHRPVCLRRRPGYVALVRTVHAHPPVAVSVAPIAGFGPGVAVRVGDAGRRRRQHLAHLHAPRYRRHPRRQCRTGHHHRVDPRRAPRLGGRHRDIVEAALQIDLVSVRLRIRIGRHNGHADARLRGRGHRRRRNEVRHRRRVARRAGRECRRQRGVGERQTGQLHDGRHQAAIHLVPREVAPEARSAMPEYGVAAGLRMLDRAAIRLHGVIVHVNAVLVDVARLHDVFEHQRPRARTADVVQVHVPAHELVLARVEFVVSHLQPQARRARNGDRKVERHGEPDGLAGTVCLGSRHRRRRHIDAVRHDLRNFVHPLAGVRFEGRKAEVRRVGRRLFDDRAPVERDRSPIAGNAVLVVVLADDGVGEGEGPAIVGRARVRRGPRVVADDQVQRGRRARRGHGDRLHVGGLHRHRLARLVGHIVRRAADDLQGFDIHLVRVVVGDRDSKEAGIGTTAAPAFGIDEVVPILCG